VGKSAKSLFLPIRWSNVEREAELVRRMSQAGREGVPARKRKHKVCGGAVKSPELGSLFREKESNVTGGGCAMVWGGKGARELWPVEDDKKKKKKKTLTKLP